MGIPIHNENISSLDLIYEGVPIPFAIKTMEEIDHKSGGIADKPHRHNYYSIIWSLGATGKHIIDFREYEILPDNIFFVGPFQVHQLITKPKPKGYVILFTPEFLEKNSIRKDFINNLRLFQNSDETPPLPINDRLSDTLKFFAERMWSSFHAREDMYFEAIGAYLKLFLLECNTHCSLFPGSNTQTIEVSKTIVTSFKNAVEKHFMDWHQVKNYADFLNVTPNYLNEVIKLATNVSAKEFIQTRLIVEAKRMIVFTDKSNKAIGFDLGFEDPSHFSKFFKNNTGLSLVEFKESIALSLI